jgi:4-hydroxybenzoate polyprenyltransferase
MESRTLPIKLGIPRTKIVLYVLIAFVAAALLHAQFRFIDNFALFDEETSSLSVRYIIFGLLLPLAYLVFMLIRAKTPADYRQASTFSKFIMLIGSLYLFVFYFLLAKGQGLAMFDLFMVK